MIQLAKEAGITGSKSKGDGEDTENGEGAEDGKDQNTGGKDVEEEAQDSMKTKGFGYLPLVNAFKDKNSSALE